MRTPGLLLTITVLAAASMPMAAQEKYTGPRPPKPDVPFLYHVDKLIETESGTATSQETKDATVYSISGPAASSARTPMAEPIFLVQAEKLKPDSLALYRMETRNGVRTVSIPKKVGKNSPRPIRLSVKQLGGTLYRVEAQEYCEIGEYCLSPEGSNQSFCFAVY
jgi:hypothetical protein